MSTIKLKSGTELPLVNLKGKDYLQVAWRIVWMREERPDWSIETEFVYQNEKSALAKATIKDATGRTMATSHKEESLQDFPAGYREKAETGAIGRALALCGFGTQFEPELDEGERIVGSPVNHRIVPEQPEPGDGVQVSGYVMPAIAGRLAGKSLLACHHADLLNLWNGIRDKYKDKVIPPATNNLFTVVGDRLEELEGTPT